MQEYLNQGKTLVITYGTNLLLALVLLFIGLRIANLISSRVKKVLMARSIEASLASFLASVVSWALKAAVFISTVHTMGFETISFVAILGSAGLAVGLALQGSLSNFAGGVIILLLKPFKQGDFITAQGYSGTVESISTFSTTLTTGDNKTIVIPNGPLANSSIVNFSTKPTRRVDFVFGIGYGDDLKKAKTLIEDHLKSDSRVLAEPGVQVMVGELADSSVNINARAWVNSSDYWPLFWETTENMKLTFDREGISIPFPQRDVHHYGQVTQ
ncbi:MAG: mechanosensitive ion channel protein MscS [Halobacteriovoraceae bacterium]|nr:mechanosensitive ion channel protein MscS [Halobacteriovoraceae bacterium]|tara:strand:+ start:18424 stop:19239 length:816 start_codon:yes stop_codon:yes gene_type:complete